MPHDKQNKGASSFLGAGTAGVVELALFHPLDTATKRLQTNKEKILNPSQPVASFQKFYRIGFGEGKLYSGFLVTGFYKVLQRTHKFGTSDYLSNIAKKNFPEHAKNHRVLINAGVGAFVGVTEVALLPFDYIKVNQQIDRTVFGNRNFLTVLYTQGFQKLYAGTATTASRNLLGSALLIGGAEASYQAQGTEKENATTSQQVFASSTAAFLSVFGTLPWDAVKTRLQKESAQQDAKPMRGLAMAKRMLVEEGPRAFFKANGLKCGIATTKVTFGFTVATKLIGWLKKNPVKNNESEPPKPSNPPQYMSPR